MKETKNHLIINIFDSELEHTIELLESKGYTLASAYPTGNTSVSFVNNREVANTEVRVIFVKQPTMSFGGMLM